MKLSCNTIQDILPLVVEDLASEDTVELVNDHLKDCIQCREEYEDLKTPKIEIENKKELEAIPLKDVKRKLRNRNIYTGVLTAFIIALALFIAFDKTTKPIDLSYDKAIELIEEEEGRVFIKFNEAVSNYEISYSEYDGKSHYNIMAWETPLSKLSKTGEAKTAVINPEGEKVDEIYYISQDGNLDSLIYGKRLGGGGRITHPRLAMNYYFSMAVFNFVIFIILSLIFRKKVGIRKVTTPILFLTLSYILSHLIILGINGTTYHMIRDFFFVTVSTILLFIIFLLSIYKDHFMRNKLL